MDEADRVTGSLAVQERLQLGVFVNQPLKRAEPVSGIDLGKSNFQGLSGLLNLRRDIPVRATD
jgi:hypothetical protein